LSKTFKKKTKGSLCGISSVVGEISPSYITLLSAAKHAMNGFLESLSNEEPGYSVTIVMPGYIKTEIVSKVISDGSVQETKLSIEESKFMTAEKAASLVLYAIEKKKKIEISFNKSRRCWFKNIFTISFIS